MKLNKAEKYKLEQEKLRTAALKIGVNLIAPETTFLSKDTQFGKNVTIEPYVVIGAKVKIGNNVVMWSGNHIGHGSLIQDHAYISSHVVICGHCNIGEMAFLGVNSAIADFCKVGARSFISMQTKVSQDLPEDAVVLPASSQVYAAEDKRAKAIRRIYFGT